jgi:hypothetical protein
MTKPADVASIGVRAVVAASKWASAMLPVRCRRGRYVVGVAGSFVLSELIWFSGVSRQTNGSIENLRQSACSRNRCQCPSMNSRTIEKGMNMSPTIKIGTISNGSNEGVKLSC